MYGMVSIGYLSGTLEGTGGVQSSEYGSGSLSTTRKETVVSFADKVRNKAEELGGRIKRNVGEVSGDWRLQAEGRADEVRANLKQAGEKIKDAFKS